MFKEEMLFFPNRLWRRQGWAVGGAPSPPLSSPLPGDLPWASLQDTQLWSPDISILTSTSTQIPHPEGRCSHPKASLPPCWASR